MLSSFFWGLALAMSMAPVPGSHSLALHIDIGHLHHPVDMAQWSVRAPGDVRCYCNLPACITTGYMCKSSGRGCFSDLVDHVDVSRARHGCLDLLDGARQRQCQNQPRPDPEVDDVPAWERHQPLGQQPSLLLCCAEDMCNHIDSPDSRTRHNALNASDLGHVTMSGPGAGLGLGTGLPGAQGPIAAHGLGQSRQAQQAQQAHSAELWFKAATIAVPICGALILFLLIGLAVRLLRTDSEHQRASKLRNSSAFPQMPSEKKVPLLSCPGAEKNLAHARLNFNGYGELDHLNGPLGSVGLPPSAALIDLHKDALAPPNNYNMFHTSFPGVHSHRPSSKYNHYKNVLASCVPWAGTSCDPPANV